MTKGPRFDDYEEDLPQYSPPTKKNAGKSKVSKEHKKINDQELMAMFESMPSKQEFESQKQETQQKAKSKKKKGGKDGTTTTMDTAQWDKF